MQLKYFKLPAEEVYRNIAATDKTYEVEIEGIKLKIHPHVYPSEKFRTTRFVLRNIKEKLPGKSVCDMGCGPGIVGLYSLANGASKVVQADINPFAVKNAQENISLNEFNEKKIEAVESDCFDKLKHQIFDVIIWNMPFHDNPIHISDPLERAFYDPNFESINKFLSQIPDYSNKSTEVFIAFSSKGNCSELQEIFQNHGFNWNIWKITNEDQEYDNRIYSLKFSFSRSLRIE